MKQRVRKIVADAFRLRDEVRDLATAAEIRGNEKEAAYHAMTGLNRWLIEEFSSMTRAFGLGPVNLANGGLCEDDKGE